MPSKMAACAVRSSTARTLAPARETTERERERKREREGGREREITRKEQRNET